VSAWIACAVLVALCARIAWVTRGNRQAVEICGLVALTAITLTALR
jgi:hypothetical protein